MIGKNRRFKRYEVQTIGERYAEFRMGRSGYRCFSTDPITMTIESDIHLARLASLLGADVAPVLHELDDARRAVVADREAPLHVRGRGLLGLLHDLERDRKSTRLNSSHRT